MGSYIYRLMGIQSAANESNWPALVLPSLQAPAMPWQEAVSVLPYLLVILVFVLTALLGPCLAALSEGISLAGKKVFHNKLAMHISGLSFWASFPVYLVLLTLALNPLISLTQQENLPSAATPVMAIPFFWAALSLIYRFSWEIFKGRPKLHFFIGLCTSVSGLGTLFLFFLASIEIMRPSLPQLSLFKDAPQPAYDSVTAFSTWLAGMASSPIAWVLLLYLFLTGLACVSAFSLPWLLLKRRTVDFGRDYYNFAVRTSAKRALVFSLGLLAVFGTGAYLIWPSPGLALAQPLEYALLGLAFGLPGLSLIFWFFILRSKTPLRHKPGIFLACLFFLSGLAAQVFTLSGVHPML